MAVITQTAIRELAAFRSPTAPVVSCYLDVDGRRLVLRQDYESELDGLLREAKALPGADTAASDLRRIEEYVKGGFDRSRIRGLAIFSCLDGGLWEVVPLPIPVSSRIVINASPAVGQLESVVQELHRCGVLLADKQRARVFVFQMGELVDHSELLDELPRDYDARGESDKGYDREQHHVEELAAQHLRQAARATFQLFQDHGFEHLTIGAPDEIARTLESGLHPYLRERLVGRINVSVGASLDDIRTAAIEVESEVERALEAEQVARLRDAVGSGNRGVAGLEPTLAALVERRVDVLFVSQGYRESGWRCPACGALARRGPNCPVDGETMTRSDDIIEEAVDAALAQSCRVEICVDNADLDVLGRIGALLRF